MIKFHLQDNLEPYKIFYKKYKEAQAASQQNIEAACLSTCSNKKIPHSRFVNIKYVNDNEFIFFSNYESLKAQDIINNNNVSLVFFWSATNIQIRIQGIVHKLDEHRSDKHWMFRQKEKNILAIASNQSSKIASYKDVQKKYKEYATSDLTKRPDYWGGYVVVPHYFEIWEGNKSRINKREAYELSSSNWSYFILEP